MLKRILDILFSVIILIITSPLFLIISVAIKIEDGGPVLFRQERVGKHGRKFRINKFRSMSVPDSAENQDFEPGNKSRITKTGSILRKLKLDELPQFINVLKGEMSVVGPRPEVDTWTKFYPERWAVVHQVRPGITDSASIIFRNEEEILAKSVSPADTYRTEILPKKLDLYEEYVRTATILLDLKIILRTIIVVLTR